MLSENFIAISKDNCARMEISSKVHNLDHLCTIGVQHKHRICWTSVIDYIVRNIRRTTYDTYSTCQVGTSMNRAST